MIFSKELLIKLCGIVNWVLESVSHKYENGLNKNLSIKPQNSIHKPLPSTLELMIMVKLTTLIYPSINELWSSRFAQICAKSQECLILKYKILNWILI